ncbi:MAG: hypothetical protein Q9224_006478 [Gallowayella concinna]
MYNYLSGVDVYKDMPVDRHLVELAWNELSEEESRKAYDQQLGYVCASDEEALSDEKTTMRVIHTVTKHKVKTVTTPRNHSKVPQLVASREQLLKGARRELKAVAAATAPSANGIRVPPTLSSAHPLISCEGALAEVHPLVEDAIAKLEKAIAAGTPATVGNKPVASLPSEQTSTIPQNPTPEAEQMMITNNGGSGDSAGKPKAVRFFTPMQSASIIGDGGKSTGDHRQPLPDPDATESDPEMPKPKRKANIEKKETKKYDPDATESDPDVPKLEVRVQKKQTKESDTHMPKSATEAITQKTTAGRQKLDPDATESDPDLPKSETDIETRIWTRHRKRPLQVSDTTESENNGETPAENSKKTAGRGRKPAKGKKTGKGKKDEKNPDGYGRWDKEVRGWVQ